MIFKIAIAMVVAVVAMNNQSSRNEDRNATKHVPIDKRTEVATLLNQKNKTFPMSSDREGEGGEGLGGKDF